MLLQADNCRTRIGRLACPAPFSLTPLPFPLSPLPRTTSTITSAPQTALRLILGSSTLPSCHAPDKLGLDPDTQLCCNNHVAPTLAYLGMSWRALTS